ncbi:hypothetical protein DENSPDRAFT_842787 [Dentipellis sp. KUC8613]|nr:hypothetical protein DENSPDRAFT_842787 [Dentipellis sp. KUC8613]
MTLSQYSPSSSFLLSTPSSSSLPGRPHHRRQLSRSSSCCAPAPGLYSEEGVSSVYPSPFDFWKPSFDNRDRAPHDTTGYPSPSSERNRNVPLPNEDEESSQRMKYARYASVEPDTLSMPFDNDLPTPPDCDLPLSPPPTHLTVPHALPELPSSSQPPEDRQDTLDLLTPLSPPWNFGLEEQSSAPTVPEESALLSYSASYPHGSSHSSVYRPMGHGFEAGSDNDGGGNTIDMLPLSSSFVVSPQASHSHVYMDEDDPAERGASSQEFPNSPYDPQRSPGGLSLYGNDSEMSGTDSSVHTPPQLFNDLPSRSSTCSSYGESADEPMDYTYYDTFNYGSGKDDVDVDALMASPRSLCTKLPELDLGAPTNTFQSAPTCGPSYEPDHLDPLLSSPSSRSSALTTPDLAEDGDCSIPHSSPSRRSYTSLPPAAEVSFSDPSLRLLSLPGAETDDDLFKTDCSPFSIDGPTLGLFMPVATASADAFVTSTRSPSPSLEPELDFPPEAAARADPEELSHLVSLRRRLWFSERNAKRTETSYVEEAQRIAADLRVSPPVPGALGDDTFAPPLQADRDPMSGVRRALQVAEHRRAEARRVRKMEKERGKELQALLRLKLLEDVPEVGEDVPIRRDGRGKVIISSMPQLVARMVFKRRDTLRPLSRYPVTAYTPSPLSSMMSSSDESVQ